MSCNFSSMLTNAAGEPALLLPMFSLADAHPPPASSTRSAAHLCPHALLFFFCLSSNAFDVQRCTTGRTPRPAFWGTSLATSCWATSSTAHRIVCGWSLTATPPEPTKASASRTQVSGLWTAVFRSDGSSLLCGSFFCNDFCPCLFRQCFIYSSVLKKEVPPFFLPVLSTTT